MKTIGAELELPDVDTTKPIPAEVGEWNMREDFVMNNIGVAADCKKKFITIGSEVNMTPKSSISGLMESIKYMHTNYETRTNHFSALHIHIGLEDKILNDLALLKKLVGYTFVNDTYLADQLIVTPPPTTEAEKKWATQLSKWRKKTYAMTYKKRIMEAESIESMGDAFQPISKGRRLTHLVSRTGMNCRSIWDRGTIEFRFFSGTDNFDEYEALLNWCAEFVDNALGSQLDVDKMLVNKAALPPVPAYNEELQQAMHHTGMGLNKRTVVKERIIEMYNAGKIPQSALGPLINV